MQAAGISSDCDWCGKAADPHDDDCIQLTCNANCHAPKECGVYHEKCIKQYLRGCSGKNYDPSRKSGFPCPRGLGKAKSTKCKGKISHMQRCVVKSKPAAIPAAPSAGPVMGSKTPAGAHTKASAKAVSHKLVAKAAAAACPAAKQPKVIKAVQVHKPLSTSLSCNGETAPAAAGTVVDSRSSLTCAPAINSSSSTSDIVAYKPDSLGGNTLAEAITIASRTSKTSAKRPGTKPIKQESTAQVINQQDTPLGGCEANSSQGSPSKNSAVGCSSTPCGYIACDLAAGGFTAGGSTAGVSTITGSNCGAGSTDAPGTVSRPSTSMTSTDIVSASAGIAASTSTSMSGLLEWGSACATDADVGCAGGAAAVRQDDYVYMDSDSDAGEVLQWSPDQDDLRQQPQQPSQQAIHHQNMVAGSYTLFGDSSIAGGLAGLAAVVPDRKAAAVAPSTGAVSAGRQDRAVLPANGKHTLPVWPEVQQQRLQQLTALQQAQMQYQQYRLQQQMNLTVQLKSVDKQPVTGTYVSSIRQMQWQSEQEQQQRQQQQVHWAGPMQPYIEDLGQASPTTAEYDATDEELLALLMS